MRKLRKIAKKRGEKHTCAERKALAISELRYRRLFETIQEGVLLIDVKTGKILDVTSILLVYWVIRKKKSEISAFGKPDPFRAWFH
jgi:hypothetical protein